MINRDFDDSIKVVFCWPPYVNTFIWTEQIWRMSKLVLAVCLLGERIVLQTLRGTFCWVETEMETAVSGI